MYAHLCILHDACVHVYDECTHGTVMNVSVYNVLMYVRDCTPCIHVQLLAGRPADALLLVTGSHPLRSLPGTRM